MRTARQSREPAVVRWIRWALVFLVLATYVVPGSFSSYRAWVQVRSLDLVVPNKTLGTGDTIRVRTVSWARTWVDVDLLVIQGNRADTLAFHRIPKNHNASIDPRWRRDSIVVVLSRPLLTAYERGPATVRATAVGGPQWLRTPPPLVRETVVELMPTQ
jgi:hypothetical protein